MLGLGVGLHLEDIPAVGYGYVMTSAPLCSISEGRGFAMGVQWYGDFWLHIGSGSLAEHPDGKPPVQVWTWRNEPINANSGDLKHDGELILHSEIRPDPFMVWRFAFAGYTYFSIWAYTEAGWRAVEFSFTDDVPGYEDAEMGLVLWL
jgi:hypothetical protein